MSVSDINGAPSEAVAVTPRPAAVDLRRREPGIPTREEVNDLARLANYLARSRFFKDAADGYQAFAKLLFGRDVGLSATAALTGVNIVEGKPELSANVQSQMIRCYVGVGGERYDYKVICSKAERAERCEIEFYRIANGRKETLGTSEFTIKDAERAGLTRPTRRGEPSNYVKYPQNMLFARAMSNGVAFHCPEVTGGIRVYHEGEIGQATATPVADVTEPVEEIPEAEIVPADEAADEPPDEAETADIGQTIDAESDATLTVTENNSPVAETEGERQAASGQAPSDLSDELRQAIEQPYLHGALVASMARVRGVPDGELAQLIIEAAGGKRVPDQRALSALPGMLERIDEPVANKAIQLIDERHPKATATQPTAEPDATSEDFASFEPQQAA